MPAANIQSLKRASNAAWVILVGGIAVTATLPADYAWILALVVFLDLVWLAVIRYRIRNLLAATPGREAPVRRERTLKRFSLICLIWAGIDALVLATGMIAGILVLIGVFYLLPRAMMAWKDRQLLKLRFSKAIVALACAATVFGWLHIESVTTKQRAGEIVAAVERYRVEHKQYPNKLEDLVPAYLPEIPRTRIGFSGTRFQYLASDSSHKLLYVTIPPFGRTLYTFEGASWSQVD